MEPVDGGAGPTPYARTAMDRLEAAVEEAADVPLSCLGDGDAVEYLCRLQRLRARLEALSCLSLTEVHLSSASAANRPVAALVAAEARVSPRALLADQTLGRWLASYRRFADAFAQGRLSRGHVCELRKLDNDRTHWQLVRGQEDLIEQAETLDWPDFVAACRYWLMVFDPDGAEPRDQVASRTCSWRRDVDGTVTGRFRLDPLSGAAVITALDGQVQRLFRQDSQDDHGSPDTHDRTASQRRADALVQLIGRGARSPEAPLPGPLVHIVMSLGVAEDLLARTAGDGCSVDHGTVVDRHRLPLQFQDIDGRCELIDGTPLHPRFGLMALLTGTLRRMVFGPGGEIIDLGRAARGFPSHLRQALLVRARGRCQLAGCTAPHAWLQADHVVPWTLNGPTALGNGQILCDPHNKAKRDTPPTPGERS